MVEADAVPHHEGLGGDAHHGAVAVNDEVGPHVQVAAPPQLWPPGEVQPREGLPGSVPGNNERASPKGMPLRIPALAASNEQAVTYRPREDSANRMIGAGEVDRECGAGLLVFTVVSNGKASGSGGSDSSRCTGQSGYQTHITRRIIHIQLNRTTRKWTSTRQQCHTQASTSSARCD